MNDVLDPEKAPVVTRIDAYEEWRKKEGVLTVGGLVVNTKELELAPWPRQGDGVTGAIVYLDGGDACDAHVMELPPGKSSAPMKHMYDEAIYILCGHGSTTVWREEGAKQTFEWGPNSFFFIPTNAWHQFFNGSEAESTRWVAATTLPYMLRSSCSEEFVFNNPYGFSHRFSGEPDYFSGEAKLYRGGVWDINFVPDVKKVPLFDWESRGSRKAFLMMDGGMMEAYISSIPVGCYEPGHIHTAGGETGAHLTIEGEGYTTTQLHAQIKGGFASVYDDDAPRTRYDWEEGCIWTDGLGTGYWLHQHFNVGKTPAVYMSMIQGLSRRVVTSDLEAGMFTTFGAHEQDILTVAYKDESPEIHRTFEEELRKRGISCQMKNQHPRCTGK